MWRGDAMRTLRLTPLLLSLLFVGSVTAAEAEVHRWIDDDGTVHYEDQAPEGTQTEALNIIPPPSGTLAAADRAAEPQSSASDAAGGSGGASGQDDDGTQALRDETSDLIRQRQCEVAQRTRTQYQGAGYLFRTDADGQQARLSEDERAAALEANAQDIANFCGGG
jgi:uncharacterized protein DUF4124